MCGIAGFIQQAPNPEALPRMLARIAHRGPDGEGTWTAPQGGWNVALGHRRLAIIDVAGGAQPMANARRRRRHHLQRRGLQLHASCARALERDGPPVPHAQRHRGHPPPLRALRRRRASPTSTACSRSRSGTRARARLTLARDRAGIKPLYYAELADGGIVFASELSALLAHGGVDRELSIEGLASYFFSDYVHPPATIVREVRKLPPGHSLVWQDGRCGLPRAYWQLPAPGPAPDPSPTRDAGRRAVARAGPRGRGAARVRRAGRHLPVGRHRFVVRRDAGGRRGRAHEGVLDRLRRRDLRRIRVRAQVAERLDVEYDRPRRCDERDLLDVHRRRARRSSTSRWRTRRSCRRSCCRGWPRATSRSSLGGDGGDELWGGYPTYRAHGTPPLYARVPGWMRNDVVGGVVGRLPIDDRYQSLEWKLRRFTERWDDDTVTRHLRWMSSVDLPTCARAIPAANGLRPATLDAPLPDDATTGCSGSWRSTSRPTCRARC